LRALPIIFCFVAVSLPFSVFAEEEADFCITGPWRLDGAAAAVKDEEATYRENWLPVLQVLAKCIKRPEHAQSCFAVQGQYDEQKFNKQITDVFGSAEAVQSSRAQSRSRRVMSALHGLGIDAEQLRETPPPSEPSFRGAEVILIPNCLTKKEAIDAMVQRAVTWTVSNEVEQKTARVVERIDAVEARVDHAQPVALGPQRKHHLYGGAALGVSSGFFSPTSGVSGTLSLSVAYATDPIHVRIALDTGVGSLPAQRVHIGFLGAVHWVYRPWLQVGLGAGMRFTSYGPIYPWYEQHWSVGVDAQHCFYKFAGRGELCVAEFLSPLGGRMRRAEFDPSSTLVRIADQTSWLLRFDLAFVIRRDFL